MGLESEMITLPEEDLAELRELSLEDLADRIKAALDDELDQLASLYGNFVKSEARYTLDDESAYIENVDLESSEKGKVYGGFTQSVYWGCKDMDDVADEQDFELDLEIDLERGFVLVSGNFPERSMIDEF